MLVIAVKLLLAPTFVVVASLTARRFGMVIGGIVGGLPVVAGPILLAFALDQGPRFAAHAAVGTLLGLVSLTTFVVLYAWLAGRRPWPVCLLAGWAGFIAVTALLSGLQIASVPALIATCATFLAALSVLPHSPPPEPGEVLAPPPSWDLAARATSAILLVLVLTSAASALGPGLSGLLAPFPIIASILAAFTHAHNGPDSTRRILRGLVLGFFAFALFCFTVAQTVDALGIAAGFAIATAVALATQAVVLRSVVLRRPREAAAPARLEGRPVALDDVRVPSDPSRHTDGVERAVGPAGQSSSGTASGELAGYASPPTRGEEAVNGAAPAANPRPAEPDPVGVDAPVRALRSPFEGDVLD